MDIRVFGRGYEELYRTSQEKYGVQFLRGPLSEAGEKAAFSHLLLPRIPNHRKGTPIIRMGKFCVSHL